jgi:DNA repair protein RadC
MGPLYLFRVAALRAPLTDRLSAAAAGQTDARCAKKKYASALLLSRRRSQRFTCRRRATQLLLDFGSLTALSRASLVQLSPFLNRERAMRLLCAFRLASLCGYQVAQDPLDSPDRIYNLFAGELIQADREILAGALIDTRFRLLKKVQISVGTLNETVAHPREIFKAAIAHSAYGFVLVHNHPSGDPAPSDADQRLTRRVVEAAKVLQIHLVDHVIIGQRRADRPPYFSFKEAGLL